MTDWLKWISYAILGILAIGFIMATMQLKQANGLTYSDRFVCVDGVEYIHFPTSGGMYGYTPHLKPDGTLFTCKVKP